LRITRIFASEFPATDEQRLQATAIVPRITKIAEAPANMKSWAVRAADENVVAKIPDRGLTCGRIVEHIVRVAVAVNVGCTCQAPATGNARPMSSSNKRWPR